MYTDFTGLLLLVVDIYAIYMILGSNGHQDKKLLWLIVVLLLPFVGPILYLVLGRGKLA